jgi:hypothetical protein
MRLLLVIGLVLSLVTVPALAQSTEDPVESVRAFYAKDDIRAYGFYSKRLKALFVRDERRARQQGGMGNLDFAFHVNGQDTEEGWRKTLKLEQVSRKGKQAEVKVTFKNFTPQELRYSLVLEGGHWLIDEVRSVGEPPWRLTTVFKG